MCLADSEKFQMGIMKFRWLMFSVKQFESCFRKSWLDFFQRDGQCQVFVWLNIRCVWFGMTFSWTSEHSEEWFEVSKNDNLHKASQVCPIPRTWASGSEFHQRLNRVYMNSELQPRYVKPNDSKWVLPKSKCLMVESSGIRVVVSDVKGNWRMD